ncbi:GyrI-like domain-containing protein [Paenibacillus sp. Z6-24]
MRLQKIQTTRTNNFKDEQMLEKIQGVWQASQPHLAQQQGAVYGVYHEYESDYKGDYSLTIAVETDGEDADHLQVDESAAYQVFPVDAADEQGVIKAWKTIWKLEEEGSLQRAYTLDYEKYSTDGTKAIHIALK